MSGAVGRIVTVTALDTLAPTSTPRRMLGALVLIIGIVLLGVCVYGTINPHHYVILMRYFRNPTQGPVILVATMLIAWIIAFPVRSTVIDRRRSQVRTTLIILSVVALIAFLIVYLLKIYQYDPQVIATSASGDRAIAVVEDFSGSHVHVYVGHGLGRRDIASLGLACGLPGGTSATFVGENEIKISTVYNDYDIHLDASGMPLNHFGATCTD